MGTGLKQGHLAFDPITQESWRNKKDHSEVNLSSLSSHEPWNGWQVWILTRIAVFEDILDAGYQQHMDDLWYF